MGDNHKIIDDDGKIINLTKLNDKKESKKSNKKNSKQHASSNKHSIKPKKKSVKPVAMESMLPDKQVQPTWYSSFMLVQPDSLYLSGANEDISMDYFWKIKNQETDFKKHDITHEFASHNLKTDITRATNTGKHPIVNNTFALNFENKRNIAFNNPLKANDGLFSNGKGMLLEEASSIENASLRGAIKLLLATNPGSLKNLFSISGNNIIVTLYHQEGRLFFKKWVPQTYMISPNMISSDIKTYDKQYTAWSQDIVAPGEALLTKTDYYAAAAWTACLEEAYDIMFSQYGDFGQHAESFESEKRYSADTQIRMFIGADIKNDSFDMSKKPPQPKPEDLPKYNTSYNINGDKDKLAQIDKNILNKNYNLIKLLKSQHQNKNKEVMPTILSATIDLSMLTSDVTSLLKDIKKHAHTKLKQLIMDRGLGTINSSIEEENRFFEIENITNRLIAAQDLGQMLNTNDDLLTEFKTLCDDPHSVTGKPAGMWQRAISKLELIKANYRDWWNLPKGQKQHSNTYVVETIHPVGNPHQSSGMPDPNHILDLDLDKTMLTLSVHNKGTTEYQNKKESRIQMSLRNFLDNSAMIAAISPAND